MPKKLFTIAFDLGGVIFSNTNDNIIFTNKYLDTTLTPGIFNVIKDLSSEESNKLIIISKAYPNNAKKSMEILKMYGLDDYFNSIIFCEDNQDKFPIAKAMKVNVMIDDNAEVLKVFDKTIKTILFTENKTNTILTTIKEAKNIKNI